MTQATLAKIRQQAPSCDKSSQLVVAPGLHFLAAMPKIDETAPRCAECAKPATVVTVAMLRLCKQCALRWLMQDLEVEL